ncbi:FixH family protein [Puniceibacterium sp. IMCC21224]|uniref:FixH family protein n=1 Tax=Puniceibacterium sp. IMCC21224 TaxID=1618204 RepID=UPI00064D7F1A|nr:FixH family protein [Puniceibacterium sp. IMCC21224]KMK67531.1 putative integral membrane protein linked to a cation pump [Puniceibacterium sp. IMCC21224]
MTGPLTGRHVLAIFCGCFSVIIGVNLTLAYQAVSTFPGLEVPNSYVASQTFDVDRTAQDALGWEVEARLDRHDLRLDLTGPDGAPVQPVIASAVLGRATHVADDRELALNWTGTGFVARVHLDRGYWVLRLHLLAADGTGFKRNITLFQPEGEAG